MRIVLNAEPAELPVKAVLLAGNIRAAIKGLHLNRVNLIPVLSPRERVRERIDLGRLEGTMAGGQAVIGECSSQEQNNYPYRAAAYIVIVINLSRTLFPLTYFQKTFIIILLKKERHYERRIHKSAQTLV